MRRLLIGAILLSSFLAQARADDPIQQSLNAAIGIAEKVCLVGDRYHFQSNANGGLTISKLLPGATANVVVDRTRARGSQFFDDEAVRRLVDDDTR
jgi:hypothetical protein